MMRKEIEPMNNSDIIRNKLKFDATISNAKASIEVTKELGLFNKYIWQSVNNKSKIHRFKSLSHLLSLTRESKLMSNS
jgi:DNA-3-methyladenine glycosylase I